jgi:hypothetical protein
MKISITVKLLASDGKTLIGEGGITLDNPTPQIAVSEAAIIAKRMCETMKSIQEAPESVPDSGPWTVSDGEWKGRTT